MQQVRTVPILSNRLFLSWCSSLVGNVRIDAGSCAFDKETASIRTRGELQERVALERAKHNGIARPGPSTDVHADLWTTEDRKEKVFVEVLPAQPLSNNMRSSVLTIPAQTVLVGWPDFPEREPSLLQTSTGTAWGRTRDEAQIHGLYEGIERISVLQLWRGERAAYRIRDIGRILGRHLIDELSQLGLRVRFLVVQSVRPWVCLCAMSSEEGRQLTFGAACRNSFLDAAQHAFTEAVQVRAALANSPEPGESSWTILRHGIRVARQSGVQLDFIDSFTGAAVLDVCDSVPSDPVDTVVDLTGYPPYVVPLEASAAGCAVKMVFPGSGLYEPSSLDPLQGDLLFPIA